MSEAMVYVGRTRCCNHIVAVTMDGDDSDKRNVAKTVAGFIRDGLEVEHIPLESIRGLPIERCTCPKEKRGKKAI